MLKEFKPTLLFLLKFGLIFGIGSFSYSYVVNQYNTQDPPQPDPATKIVAEQTFGVIKILGYDAHIWYPETEPTVGIYITGFIDDSIGVYEGCNGVNIVILFIAFVVAFGGNTKNMLWFIPSGIVAIHLFNLARLAALAVMATISQSFFHFVHKYAFTGIIYFFVLILWIVWVKKFYKVPVKKEDDAE